MGELGLQPVELAFGLLFFAEIPNESGEHPVVTDPCFPDMEMDREIGAVLPACRRHAADADYPPFPGRTIAPEIVVMKLAVWGGHQRTYILAQHVRFLVAEHSFGRDA